MRQNPILAEQSFGCTMRTFLSLVFLPLMLLFSITVYGDDEIVIHLETESKLSPLYLAELSATGQEPSEGYYSGIQQILAFDLNFNGRTQVLPHNEARKNQAQVASLEKRYHSQSWTALGASYVVRPILKSKNLSIEAYSVGTGKLKSLKEITLTGDLKQDRRILHQVSDAIYKGFFGEEGVSNSKILYTIGLPAYPGATDQWVSEVWECDYDGGNPRQITQGGAYCVTPTYVPGQKGFRPNSFFYVSYRQGQPKIYFASLKNGLARRFTSLRGNQLMPCVSLQRDAVTFISDAAGNPDVFLQTFNPELGAIGKPRQVYSVLRATQGSPVFSPSGNQIAFVSNKDGPPRIYITDVTNGEQKKRVDLKARLISKKNRENTSPSWSPDGSKIAYSSMTGGVRQIWIYDVIKQEEVQITFGPGHKENPSWAPDSLHLVFNSANQHSCDLFLINLNQSKAVKITSGPGEKRFPAWEPRT